MRKLSVLLLVVGVLVGGCSNSKKDEGSKTTESTAAESTDKSAGDDASSGSNDSGAAPTVECSFLTQPLVEQAFGATATIVADSQSKANSCSWSVEERPGSGPGQLVVIVGPASQYNMSETMTDKVVVPGVGDAAVIGHPMGDKEIMVKAKNMTVHLSYHYNNDDELTKVAKVLVPAIEAAAK